MASILENKQDNTTMSGKNKESRFCISFKTMKNGSNRSSAIHSKPNQDSFFAWFKDCDVVKEDHLESPTPFGAFGVIDGHGSELNLGGKLSIIASRYMNLEIPKRWVEINHNPMKEVYKLFSDLNELLFMKVHEILLEKKNNVEIINKTIHNGTERKYLQYSNKGSKCIKKCSGGCTASITFILENGIIISGHVGDSDTYIFKNDKTIPLFEKHSPESILERARIIREYGQDSVNFIYDTSNRLSRPSIFNESINNIIDPNILFNQGHSLYCKNVSGEFATMISTPYYELNLAMTRSLGDFYIGAYGCSSEPTIIQSKLDSDIQIVCASDGIWDNWKIEDFREFLYTTNFEETFEKSVELAKNNFGRSHDDMTLMEFRFI
tara:strand:- start:655 stop:1794 length:1140 start_codon:yes stop_codon:yes gene_type:complete